MHFIGAGGDVSNAVMIMLNNYTNVFDFLGKYSQIYFLSFHFKTLVGKQSVSGRNELGRVSK